RDVSEAFQPQHYRHYAAQIHRAALDAAARLAHDSEVDLEAEMLKLSLDIIGKTLFSVNLLDQANELSRAVAEILRHLTARIQNPLSLGLGGTRAAVRLLDTMIFKMIEARRVQHSPPPDLLTSLVRLELSTLEIRDALMNLFVAGHETSGTSLAWTLYLLATHPAPLARLQAEVRERIGSREVNLEAAGQLPYTLQTIKESMRLYPPVHSLGRQARRAVRIGRHELKRGALVVVSTYLLQRREDYFSEPLLFKPERFETQAEAVIPKNAYLPFGLGARACIGKHFALLQAQIILATLATRVRFEVQAGTPAQPEMLITLRPRNGIRARVQTLKVGAS
ncbi:MAG: cytochrome P450, partial [Deltaproteobacteria bacterium]|nr:cytochrome P450 [Deltaproteobacteria bacterium]